MSKNMLPAEVVLQMMNLPLEAVKGAMEWGGAYIAGGYWDDGTRECYTITGAKFLGMMSNGAFVYECEGSQGDKPLPTHIKRFKVGVRHEPKFLENFKPEYQDQMKPRQICGGDYNVYWK